MENHYSDSWEIYKAHTEGFKDDYEHYLNFSKGYKSIELFAGYGRLSNFLAKKNVDLETIELEEKFSRFINLPEEKKHVCNVLNFSSNSKFERIFAGYNSFCLIIEKEKIIEFFKNIDGLLSENGFISLSYYDHNFWKEAKPQRFIFKGKEILHIPSCDLSAESNGYGIWIDNYKIEGSTTSYKYPIRIYKNKEELSKFLRDTRLEIVSQIIDYNNPDITDHGWIEYILQKKEKS